MAFDGNLNSSGDNGKRPADDNLKSNGKTRKRLTILSIDGGAVRGIISAKILQVLESYLQDLEKTTERKEEPNETTHELWEYFDMIAGTSSGGLITAMITTPNVGTVKDQPVRTYSAKEVVEFFTEDAAKIFPEKFTNMCYLRWLWEGFASLCGPIYRARSLEKLLHDKFGEALLSQAHDTSVIIPAFDTVAAVPVFFSNRKGVDEANPLYNVRVKDACRGTTAVPILFPPASFKEVPDDQNTSSRKIEEFNVIDGGIAVNDPTLVAVTQAMAEKRQAIFEEELRAIEGGRKPVSEEELQAIAKDRPLTPQEVARAVAEERSRCCMDFTNVLVLSLGTGAHPMRFIADPHWSSAQWLLNRSGSPLLSSFLSASEDMTDELSESEVLKADDASTQNLNQLEEAAKELVRFHEVSRNSTPKKHEKTTDYGRALYSFARLLVEERRNWPKTKDLSGKGESPRDEKEGPDETLRHDTAPSTAGAVQTKVGGCCRSMMVAVILLVLGIAVFASSLLSGKTSVCFFYFCF
ncbi:hypothetical protein CY35_04G137800 [Sphagnum magellanicum]|nr:hypothetical protein CY35_04G137800 [Sphagnum magellanicum]KAH9566632.1 hypothetical protein CY35_04G137800 [Sphagnum magellanicum]